MDDIKTTSGFLEKAENLRNIEPFELRNFHSIFERNSSPYFRAKTVVTQNVSFLKLNMLKASSTNKKVP